MDVGVIIPAYNEGRVLGSVLSKVLKYIPGNRIYVIDDGSRDDTAGTARLHGVRLVSHPENRGKGEALKTGFKQAITDNLDFVITLDGDGQHAPEVIPNFLKLSLDNEQGLVVGFRRFKVGTMPLDRILSNRLSSLIVSALARCWIPDSQCGYRMIRAEVLREIELRSSNYELETELLIKAARKGYNITTCEVPVIYDKGSTSNIRRFQDTYRFCRLCLKLIFQ